MDCGKVCVYVWRLRRAEGGSFVSLRRRTEGEIGEPAAMGRSQVKDTHALDLRHDRYLRRSPVHSVSHHLSERAMNGSSHQVFDIGTETETICTNVSAVQKIRP